MGGIPFLLDFLVLLLQAIAKAFSKFFGRFLRESNAYHAAPLRGRPLSLSMYRSNTMAEIPVGRVSLFLHSEGSVFDLSISQCIPNPPRRLIRMQVMALAIKAVFLML